MNYNSFLFPQVGFIHQPCRESIWQIAKNHLFRFVWQVLWLVELWLRWLVIFWLKGSWTFLGIALKAPRNELHQWRSQDFPSFAKKSPKTLAISNISTKNLAPFPTWLRAFTSQLNRPRHTLFDIDMTSLLNPANCAIYYLDVTIENKRKAIVDIFSFNFGDDVRARLLLLSTTGLMNPRRLINRFLLINKSFHRKIA